MGSSHARSVFGGRLEQIPFFQNWDAKYPLASVLRIGNLVWANIPYRATRRDSIFQRLLGVLGCKFNGFGFTADSVGAKPALCNH